MIFQHPGIGDSKSVKQARDMDIPEIWKHSPGINPYPGNGGNRLQQQKSVFFDSSSSQMSTSTVQRIQLTTSQHENTNTQDVILYSSTLIITRV